MNVSVLKCVGKVGEVRLTVSLLTHHSFTSSADVPAAIDSFHLFLTCAPQSASPSHGTSPPGSPALSSPAPFAPPRSAAAPLLPSFSPPPSSSPPHAGGEKTQKRYSDVFRCLVMSNNTKTEKQMKAAKS